MGLFDFLKKKRPKMIIEMVGYKNGETVDLVSNTSTKTGELTKRSTRKRCKNIL